MSDAAVVQFGPMLRWLRANTEQALIALGAAALLAMLLIGLRKALAGFAHRHNHERTWQAVGCDLVGKTTTWFIIALAARLVVQFAPVPPKAVDAVKFLFVIAATLQAAIWVRTLAVDLIERRAASGGAEESTLGSAINIIRLLITVAVFAIAVILVLDNLGVNVTGLVAGLGVGGIAIGLAAQGIFSDLFAALSIIFDKPFRVGDTIAYQGKEGPITGTVEEIGLKSTRVRAAGGELRIISNAKLLEQELTNFAGRSVFRHKVRIGVTYQTPADLADQIPDLMRSVVERFGHEFVTAGFIAFGASSLDYELLFESDVSAGEDPHRAFQEVGLGLLRQFGEKGIDFAYPTQTSFTAAPDGRLIMPYPDG